MTSNTYKVPAMLRELPWLPLGKEARLARIRRSVQTR